MKNATFIILLFLSLIIVTTCLPQSTFQVTITLTNDDNGTVEPSKATSVNIDESIAIKATPSTCYAFSTWEVISGSATISDVHSAQTTVRISDNTVIIARFVKSKYTLDISASDGGITDPTGTINNVDCGYPFNIKAKSASGSFSFIHWESTAGDPVIADSNNPVTTVTLNSGNASVKAVFGTCVQTITASANAGGTIMPVGNVSVACGLSQKFDIAADSCHTIQNVLVDGVSQGAINTYTLTSVTTNHTIQAVFVSKTYTVNITTNSGGTTNHTGNSTVNCGDNLPITITPDSCYNIGIVIVDGESQGVISSYLLSNITANHTISVQFTLKQNTITVSAAAGGSISPVTGSVNCGADPTYTITPDGCHTLGVVTVDGVSQGSISSYTFYNVTTPHTISATFGTRQYTISAAAGLNGSIDHAGIIVYNCGSNATYNISPNSCYAVQSLLVDGESQGAIDSYTFTNIAANHSIVAQFTQRQFTVNATAGTGGTINPAGKTTINCGAGRTYTITPNNCYSISDVTVDGVSIGVKSSYPFSNVTADHTIDAQFAQNQYIINASAGTGGTINPAGNTTIYCGADQTYAITPGNCYSISDVIVDGVSQGSISSYTFSNVSVEHTISAQFEQPPYTITASAGTGGSISPATATHICGSSATFTATPNSCYVIQSLLVDGISQGAITSYTFTNISANHSIVAQFVLKQYTITATASAGGTINLMGVTTINCGGSQQYTATPNSCYNLSSLTVDGVTIPANTYSFWDVNANHTIAAQFSQNQYTITASASAGGSISPSTGSVLCGADQTFTITHDSCSYISDVKVDGVSKGPITSYSFYNISSYHSIAATFAKTQYTLTINTVGAEGMSPAYIQINGGIPYSGLNTLRYSNCDSLTLTVTCGGTKPGPAGSTLHAYFNGWGGDVYGSANPATLIMDGDKSVTAYFGWY